MESNNENRAIKFARDFGIYSIGIFGTRIITFLMIPLYTYFIDNTSDFGVYDMCLQICIFLLPISTLQLREASFRFLIETDSENYRRTIISIVCKILFFNIFSLSLLTIILSHVINLQYFYYSLFLLISMTLHEVFGQITRGLKKNNIYVACNLINATLIGSLSLLFVAFLGMGIKGVFLANIFSRIITVLTIECRVKILRFYCVFKTPLGITSKEIIRYSLPLIPTTICWIITTITDRFFISYYVSFEANGIYAVIIRFTMVLQTIALIFYQTWQETAITQYNTKDRDSFFSKVFNYYFFALVLLTVLFSFLLKMNYTWLVSQNYQIGINYFYTLGVISILMSVSSSFLELGYQCGKDTKRALPALFFSVIINVVLNFTITPYFGVNGVIISNFFTFLFLCIYRFIDTRRYFKISIYKNTYILPLIIILGFFLYSIKGNLFIDIISLILLTSTILYFSPKELLLQIQQKFIHK